ncbi:MAG: glycosyltransferase family 2 protein [Bdellovibrionales bacterium]
MIHKVLALIIDFRTQKEAELLSLQLMQFHQGLFELKVVHVDNGNDERVTLSSEQKKAGVELLRVPENHGYASGLIAGIEAFKDFEADAYWMLNSDLEIEEGTLEKLVQVLSVQPRVGAIGPTVHHGRSKKVWGARGVVSPMLGATAMIPWEQGGVLPKWSYIPGSSLLARREAYEEVGGLPSRYRMYYEETELCVKLQQKGWDLWVEPKSKAFHTVLSMKSRIPARHYAFYFTRNNLYFWQHNFSIPWFVQWPRMTAVVAKEILLPLRRAGNVADLKDRLKYLRAGFADAREFLKHQYTKNEKELFLKKNS